MKKWFLNMLVVGVLGTFAVSCSDEYDGLSQELDSNKAQVVFSVAMDTPSTRSRATDTWGDDFTPSAPGDEYDNRIDLEQFIIKIESEGKTYPITDVIKWKEKDSEVNEYKFVGVVQGMTSSVTLENVKINVYANMGSNPDADFDTMTFGQDAENIPMWGVLTADKLEFAPGKRTELPTTISLLRAMAKFQVGISDAMIDKGYALTAASLNKFNPIGNCMPSGYATADNTTAMGQESVLNENTTGQVEATALPVAETGKSYVVYLPEISNTSDSELKMLLTFTKGDTERIETEVSVKDYSADNTGLLNIVRNHWYKYVISDIVNGEPVVEYSTVEWINKEIEVGGEGFLVLNKDVIEIYNANIDADQLKFSSSSPIKRIMLKDIYKHERNGSFTEGTEDGVYAYYMDKFGVLTQLSSEEGSDEAAVLANISASVKEENKKVLNGGIVINSPFINHEILGNSHFSTIRYLEFEVENEQGLKATFRVMQYPPVVITNVEGFYSYRDDFIIGENDAIHHNPDAFQGTFGKIAPKRGNEPIHYQNPASPFFTLAGFLPYHIHECNSEGVILSTSCPSAYEGYEELLYGFMERNYHRTYNFGGPIASVFHRDHYQDVNGNHMASQTVLKPGENESNYYQALGLKYYDEETGKYYRRHYTGNFFETFWPKIARNVHISNGTVDSWEWSYEYGTVKDEVNNTGKTSTQAIAYGNKITIERQKGEADIYKLKPNENYDGWKNNPYTRYLYKKWRFQSNRWKSTKTEYENFEDIAERDLSNHRMYHIKTIKPSSDYIIGYPTLEDENGNLTTDSSRGLTAEGKSNSRMVSPSFMVASQLGETILPKNEYHYVMPGVGGIYYYARRQCQEYVETSYEDKNNNYQWDEGEPVTHYHDWRLPTEEEIKMIVDCQEKSRAMDVLLNGQYYFYSSSLEGVYDENTVLSSEINNFTRSGYYVRCVRDVKPGEKENK